MSDKNVANAVEKIGEANDEIRLSTGVVLRGKQANPLSLLEVMAQHPAPTPPMQYIQTMGRMVENAADPDYIARRDSWKTESSNDLVQALILLGTELVSIPKGFPGPKSDEWIENMRLLGLDVYPDSKNWRYLKWVLHEACRGEEDIAIIQEVVGRLSGLSKLAVKTAEEFHASDKED